MIAAVKRTDKYQAQLNPVSGADIWLIAPGDGKGRYEGPDLHLTLERAEEVVYLLLQRLEDARQLAVDSEDG